jgi:hypothetical protein
MTVSVLVRLERFARGRFAHGTLLASPVPNGIQEILTIDFRARSEIPAR